MSRLVPCPDCKRHVRAASTACPHCGRSSGALTFAAITMSAGLALAGCDRPITPAPAYGPPAQDPTARIPAADPTPAATATAAPTATATDAPTAAPTSTAAATTTATSSAAPKPTATTTSSLGTITPTTGTGKGPSAAYGPPPRKPKDRLP